MADIMQRKTNFQFFFIVLLCCGVNTAFAQLESISTVAEYSSVLSKRNNLSSASAVGGNIQIMYSLSDQVSLGFKIGYKLYSISQSNQLVNWG